MEPRNWRSKSEKQNFNMSKRFQVVTQNWRHLILGSLLRLLDTAPANGKQHQHAHWLLDQVL